LSNDNWLKPHDVLSNIVWMKHTKLIISGAYIKASSCQQILLFQRWVSYKSWWVIVDTNLKNQFMPINIDLYDYRFLFLWMTKEHIGFWWLLILLKENVTGWTLHLLKKDIILGVIQSSGWYAFDPYLFYSQINCMAY
jgi:hypothetical protein